MVARPTLSTQRSQSRSLHPPARYGRDRVGASSPRPALHFRRNVRFQEFLRGVELRLELILRDPCEDRLAELEEAAWLTLEGGDNLGPVTFRFEGVGQLERKRFVGLLHESLVGLVLDHVEGRVDLPTQESGP